MENKWEEIIGIGALILAFLLFLIILNGGEDKLIDEDIVKCIGEKSHLYTQLGCHACERQEDIFGESYKYLTITDCFYEREKCGGIEATPTWIIDGIKYEGIRSIEELKEITKC